MEYDRRYLKRISGFTGIQIAANQGRLAAENMTGQNHYPPGSRRHAAWQENYQKTCMQIAYDIEFIYRDMDEYVGNFVDYKE